ncbi:uncharacterized protein TRIADDRAFT_51379 [Trichoplax adhaerens]|uniref:RRM domain-containing protein n=1 Tax=Trichoplax adhaerens TaxID=10228 RepID=B3RIV1_TRIAD|nr:hypothetical protein TRIADDRAFT_51379 [Trichoplax adhaerens]EDV29258.1 hypothetical protein TRIADDRAFT_51379 [Trichoplax adhaerens]|eukprot:XP_002108460.1 hypothetical protein TRIADDRAFT_51379 [Trichoplax adhaerens]
MSTFSYSYKKYTATKRSANDENANGPLAAKRSAPLHPQTHNAETLTSGKRLKFDPAAKLFIGNLSWDTTLESLAHYFSSFGKLMDAKIIKDHDTGNSKGFAFVTYSSAEEALHCRKWCAMNYPRLDGRNIYVSAVEWQPKALRDAKREEKRKAKEAENSVGPTLQWEFKWSSDKDAEVHGPYDTRTMLNWSKAGYFTREAFVRQVDFNSISDWIAAQDNDNNGVDDSANVLSEKTEKQIPGLVAYSDEDSDSENDTASVERENDKEKEISTVALDKAEDESKQGRANPSENFQDDDEENFSVPNRLEFIPISEIDFTMYP